jgi:hypothetical protein
MYNAHQAGVPPNMTGSGVFMPVLPTRQTVNTTRLPEATHISTEGADRAKFQAQIYLSGLHEIIWLYYVTSLYQLLCNKILPSYNDNNHWQNDRTFVLIKR